MDLFVKPFLEIVGHMFRLIKTAETIIWERVPILGDASPADVIYIKIDVQKDPFSITWPHIFTEVFLEGKLPFTSLIFTLLVTNCWRSISP